MMLTSKLIVSVAKMLRGMNRLRDQNVAGVNRQRGQNDGANCQHGGVSQNNPNQSNSRERGRSKHARKAFFFRKTKKNH